MQAYAVTLQVPSPVYDHFRRRAAKTHRSVEAELLDAVSKAASDDGNELPSELSAKLAALEDLDDHGLWQAARSSLEPKAREELAALNFKQQGEGLSEDEKETLWHRVEEYEHTLLIRAQAAKLLKDRGHDVSELVGV